MVLRVDVPNDLIVWARERSGIERAELARRFPIEAWEANTKAPTLRQLEGYAKATHTPIGFFFLTEPPEEPVPIPDFRTVRDETITRPSPDLLDTIYECQQRQEWFRRYAAANEFDPVEFVASATIERAPEEVAQEMRDSLDFDPGERGNSWSEAFRTLSEHAEGVGVLVMVNGIVGNNTHRKLDPNEFRGFALVDDLAPTVFVNGADTKAAQIFTLAHELAHLWLGQAGLDDLNLGVRTENQVERWCNAVAAELLVPLELLHRRFRDRGDLVDELDRLAREFKVSTLVILRRLYEANYLDWRAFRAAYTDEVARVLELAELREGREGGNFYNTQPLRVSKTFARALVSETLAGRTTYTDAFHLLGLRKSSTLFQLGEHLGVA